MMNKGFTALKNGTWEEYMETFRKKMKASEWAFDRIKEAFDLVARDEAEKTSVVQEIMLKIRTSGENCDWKQPNRLLVVRTGESVSQAKVFKAHAIPQNLCEILIDPLKLLANQQEDGDGLLQSRLTSLNKGSRKSLTDGLRDFIKVDDHRALDVGEQHQGTGTLKVRKPKVPEGGSDVTNREGPDELTLRAEEVNTLKAYIDVNHIEPAGKMGPSPG